MAKKLEMYKCDICGNLVEVVLEGAGELVCCGKPMKLLESNSVDGMGEKHVPVFEEVGDDFNIKIGSQPHPMTAEHYIQFIEVVSKDGVYIKRKYLNPEDEPLLRLKGYDKGKITAKEYCNIHGLWESENY